MARGGKKTVNKLLKVLTFFIILFVVAENFPFSSISSASGSSKLTADSSPFTFGNTEIGSYFDQNDPNAKSASYFTCGTDGQVADIYAYISRAYTTGSAKAAIYADNSGQAGALIAQSNAVTVTTSFSWVDFPLPTPEDVTSGSVYWLAICSDESLNIRIVLDSGVRIHNQNEYAKGFSDPFGPEWGPDPSGAMSIYASGYLDHSEFSASISPTSASMILGANQQFSSTVTGGVSPYSYQWYLNDTAVSGGNDQTWIFNPTRTGNYEVYLNVIDALSNLVQSNVVTDIFVFDQSNFNFSIMQITDSQTLNSAYLPDNPDLYSQLCNWIVNNTGTYNLKMVVHTGDIINEYWDTSQWQYANDAMNILSNNNVPYVWCAGNHDQTTVDGWSGNPNSGWVGEEYSAFDSSSFSNKTFWAGDCFEGKNTAAKFSVGNYNFLVIDIEAFANDSTLDWMKGLLDTYSNLNYNIVVATHIYLSAPNGDFANSLGDGSWEANLQNLLNEYPNVFMTLNGHCGGDPAINVHNQVNGRTQIEYDRQETENLKGACSVRIYTFNLNSQTITVSTYSVWDNQWITDSGDSFSFSCNLTSVPTVKITPTNVRMALGRSQNFNSSVSGGKLPYSFHWYLNDSTVSGATSQNWTFTPTTIGHYKVYLNVTDALSFRVQSNIVTDIVVYDNSHFNFSIMQITDTQFLASTYPGLDKQLSTWIVNNNASYNLKMVVHTGDLTDQYYDGSQWQNANDTMTILMNNGIPYTWCAGNHDQNGFSDPNSGWVGNKYAAFNPATFEGNSYWVNDSIQGKSTAVKFSVNGYNFLIINLECQANATTMSWATNLLNTYSRLHYNIIVATHAYLDSPSMTFDNGLSGSPTWEQNLQSLLNNYPNVIMTLNGHTDVDPTMDVHNVVNGREQIEFDRQTTENRKGACSVRIYSFDLNSQNVEVSTYSVWNDQWLTESQDAFSFSTNLISIPTASITPTLVRMDLGQSQRFSSNVSAGISPYFYQWYLNDSTVSGATSQNWTFTPTTTGHYKVYVNSYRAVNIEVQSNIVADIIVYPTTFGYQSAPLQ